MRKNHPLSEKLSEHKVSKLYYDFSYQDIDKHFIEITLKHEESVKVLKFHSPVNIKIEDGFPNPKGGIEMKDDQLDGQAMLYVKVSDFETSHGSITFWAKEVKEIS
ncbi:MAG: hypothetical protein ACJ75J_12345 [Cytophagaceae bacterium]|jgi:hypothetical protein